MPGPASHSVEFPYLTGRASATMRGVQWLGALDVKPVAALSGPGRAVREALERPGGLARPALAEFRPGDRVLILVSDSFRQTRADQMLPPLLEALAEAGIADATVSVLFSTGVHRPPTVEEQREILGEAVFARLAGRIFCHDAYDAAGHERLGVTSRGTPVEINRRLTEADRVIATGTVVLHYFGGFGGGRKSVVPGVASAATIAKNHSLNLHPTEDRLDPAVRIATLDGNPVGEDMLEAARMVRVDFILNTVLTRDGEIATVFCGEMDAAHRRACDFAREMYAVPIARRADLVIAASPHTRNFVQTHKALYNAYQAMRPGGRIVLVAPCPEGLGSERFAQWLALGDRAKVISALRERSEINGQTALSTIEKAPSTLFVTEMSGAEVAQLGGRKADSLQNAVDTALGELSRGGAATSSIYVMPSAAYTVPMDMNDEKTGFTR
jgi:nickel-dependent lactate racemase